MSSQKADSEVPAIPKKVVKFQCGLFREEIPFIGEDALCLTPEILQEYMCDLLDLRVCYIRPEAIFCLLHDVKAVAKTGMGPTGILLP